MQFNIQLSVSNEESLHNKQPLRLEAGIWLIGFVFQGWGANGSVSPKTYIIGLEGASQIVSTGNLVGSLPVSSDVAVGPSFMPPALYHVMAHQPYATLSLSDTEPSTVGRLSGDLWIFAERISG